MAESKAPKIEYPPNFTVPGPAAQADFTLDAFLYFLDDHVEDYVDPNQFDSPEDFVEFRKLYSAIHWMYEQLVGEEDGSAKN